METNIDLDKIREATVRAWQNGLSNTLNSNFYKTSKDAVVGAMKNAHHSTQQIMERAPADIGLDQIREGTVRTWQNGLGDTLFHKTFKDAVVRTMKTGFVNISNILFDIIPKGLVVIVRNGYQLAAAHPRCTALALLMWSFNPVSPFLLPFQIIKGGYILILDGLGFTVRGVRRGSLGSQYQSTVYRGYIPGDSTFSTFQSDGAIGNEQSGVVRIFGWALFVGALVIWQERGR